MGRWKQTQARTRRGTIRFATLYLTGFTIWVLCATFALLPWPWFAFVFFAGMEFEYLTVFVISPWVQGRDPFEI